MRLTREQRVALKRIYDRPCDSQWQERTAYREFRRTVQQGWGCAMVHWCGIWLGIEPDGYTHS